MLDNLIQWIRRKTREEWLLMPRENVMAVRIWIQEHPEQGFVVGLLGGILLVIFFRLVLLLLLVAVVLYAVIIAISVPTSRPVEGAGEGQ